MNNNLYLGIAYLSVITIISILKKRKRICKRNRKIWTRKWIERRQEGRGLLSMVESELLTEDHQAYRNFLRMDNIQFNKLLSFVQCDIQRQNTNKRECISATRRLAVTLRYLATGETYRSLMYSTRIHESTLSLIIPETINAIYTRLKDIYIKIPSDTHEWEKISEDFEKRWNFPLCIGAIDGKHINFRPPSSAGSYYYNYKGKHSIVLLAVVDANYKFIYIDAGVNGRISDGGVYRESSLKEALEGNLLKLPGDKCLPGQLVTVPYVLVGDEAFPLSRRMMKPFPNRGLDREKRIYNYRLSRARRVVENAFGILANRFRILLGTINSAPEKVENIVLACCALHNFLATENSKYLESPQIEVAEVAEHKEAALQSLQQYQGSNRPPQEALVISDNFKQYFNSVGLVPWQEKIVNVLHM